MIEYRFKTRIMSGLVGAIGFIYFYNNPDNFDAAKVYVKNVCFSSYNSLSGFFKFNLHSTHLIAASTPENDDNSESESMCDDGNNI